MRKDANRLATALHELREEQSPEAWRRFMTATARDWDAMARDLAAAWRIPPGVDAEDVRQELLLALHEQRLLERWDGRQPLAKFAVWNAYVGAKRFIHRQRAALRRDGKAPSRHPLAFSGFDKRSATAGARDMSDVMGFEGVTEAQQEQAIEAAEIAAGFRLLLGSERRRLVFDALRGCDGDPVAATAAIWADPVTSIRCEIGSEDEAAAAVADTVAAIELIAADVFAA